ncbi:MAG: hypothetical protein ACYCX2_01445 [Christensenellales bacterium]
MNNYKEMYTILFNKITDIIDALQKIQQQTEDMYAEDNDEEIVFIKPRRLFISPKVKEHIEKTEPSAPIE